MRTNPPPPPTPCESTLVSLLTVFLTHRYPYWEGKSPETQTLQQAITNGLNQVEAMGFNAPIWITETGWPYEGPTQKGDDGAPVAVASPENAQTYYEAVGCNQLFGKYNVWWHTLEDANLDGPHFGVTGGAGEGKSLFPDMPDLTCSGGGGNETQVQR